MVLVDFDRDNQLWLILARKTGLLPNKLVLVNFGQVIFVDFD